MSTTNSDQKAVEEIARIQSALLDPNTTPEQYSQLYAAQQALAWVEDARVAKSPYSLVMGIQADSEDCSGVPRPSLS